MKNPKCKNCGGRDWLLYKSVTKSYYTQVKDGEKNKWIENTSTDSITNTLECAKCGGSETEEYKYKIIKKRGDYTVVFLSEGLDPWFK
jgi:hypothetical protein